LLGPDDGRRCSERQSFEAIRKRLGHGIKELRM